MTDPVTLEAPTEGVALITVDLSESLGFVSWSAVNLLADMMAAARTNGARVIVLASAMEGHWFEHAWLPDLLAMVEGEEPSGDPEGWWTALEEITHRDVITIAAIDGDTSGGGAELGWACDLRVAGEQVWFGQPEVQIALATGIGGSSRLARLIGRTATAEMVLDGAPMTAPRIYELGGINRLVAPGTAVDEAVAWAARLGERPAHSITALKATLAANDDMPLTDALANEQRLFGGTVMHPDGVEGMRRAQARFEAGETVRQVYGPPNR